LFNGLLGILVDPQTVVQTIPGVDENAKTTAALRVSGTVTPPMDLHFDPESFRLVRMDWREDIYRFSDWKEHDGAGYHAKTAIYKRDHTEPWFHHEITALERLSALPDGLSR
jgi:hypothetical protein